MASGGIRKALVVVGGVMTATAAYAGDNSGAFSLPNFSSSAFERIAKAYNEVQGSPAIRELLKNQYNSLSVSKHVTSENIDTVKFQHYFKGLEVVGSMALHHVGKNGVQKDDALARFDLDTKPAMSADDAAGIARSLSGDQELRTAPELKILPDNENNARLVYWVKLAPNDLRAGRQVVIDAHTGAVIADISNRHDIAIQVYSGGDSSRNLVLPDGVDPRKIPASAAKNKCQIITSDGSPLKITLGNCRQVVTNSTPSMAADGSAQRALSNAQTVLGYWQNTHGRNSYDNQGSQVNNVIHAGVGMGNAFWDQDDKLMAYGDGDGKVLGDMTLGLDVVGHEMTHAVTNSEVELVHMYESGAIDEALADFFAMMVTNQDNWVLGKRVFLNSANAEGIRNLRDPGSLTDVILDARGNEKQVQYPSTMAQEIVPATAKCDGTNDLCYVHLNSTIPSHASYLVHEAIGHDKAQKLYYAVQQQYLTARESFQKIAQDAYSACQQLFDSGTCDQVKAAYAQTGLNVTGGSNPFLN